MVKVVKKFLKSRWFPNVSNNLVGAKWLEGPRYFVFLFEDKPSVPVDKPSVHVDYLLGFTPKRFLSLS